jgi:hypothetical protein
MKSLNKILLAGLLLTSVCYVSASPNPTAKIITNEIIDRHLSGFSSVDLGGPFDVYITQGSEESVKVEAPTDMMEHIITEVVDGELKVYSKHDNWHWGDLWGNHRKIIVRVVIKDVNSLHIGGSGDMFFRDGITSNSLKLHISGSGDMKGRVETKTLESSISGSGDMSISGTADNSTVSVVGSGDFAARDLTTIKTAVRVSGSGGARINAREEVDASVNGSGDVSYTGDAKVVHTQKTGSGDIRRF